MKPEEQGNAAADSRRPLKLLPNRVWRTYEGGGLLDRWHGADAPSDGAFPEDWVGSLVRAANVGREQITEGYSQYIGSDGTVRLLKEAVERSPQSFLGSGHVAKYGVQSALLVKALDSSERLTIQVHPDRKFAKEQFQSDYGKTEAWYVLGGRTIDGVEPYLLMGFKPGITREVWRKLFEAQDIEGMVNALHQIPLREGEVFLVEGGVPHAIGSGCFLIEIQEPTDLTLRTERTTPRGHAVPDQACHQGIGFERMLDCFHYEDLSYDETMQRWKKDPILLTGTEEGSEWQLIGSRDTDCFRMHRLEVAGRWRLKPQDSFFTAIAVKGSGKLSWAGGELSVRAGDSFFIPADSEELELIRSGDDAQALQVLLCFPPA